MPGRTPSQTIGPFFHVELRWQDGEKVVFAESGKRIVLTGRMIDGGANPIGDAMVETWQSSPKGAEPAAATGESNPHGFARMQTAPDGTFRIETMMPGGATPFIDVSIFARGLLKPLRTRAYLAPEDAVRRDPALKTIASSPRLKTLVATPVSDAEWNWDVRLQGEGETVFFAF